MWCLIHQYLQSRERFFSFLAMLITVLSVNRHKSPQDNQKEQNYKRDRAAETDDYHASSIPSSLFPQLQHVALVQNVLLVYNKTGGYFPTTYGFTRLPQSETTELPLITTVTDQSNRIQLR